MEMIDMEMTSAPTNKYPKGIPYIIGNELAERFSYYGMKTILTIFMTHYLLNQSGQAAPMTEGESKVWFHLFVSANYFFPILGAILADMLWGKYKTIISLSIVYCLGHLALAVDETRLGLSLGLTLIAIGSGGIKPCVSANVGDQFTKNNEHLIGKVFNLFYLSINVGSIVSTLLTPLLLRWYGPSVAFGVPGALMLLATLIFWAGRKHYTVIQPVGPKAYFSAFADKNVIKSILGLITVYLFCAVFWALYEQTGSSWVLQASSPYVIKTVNLGFGNFEILPDQLQSLNPLFVLIFVPLFALYLYPWLEKRIQLHPLKKISIGLFITALSFVIIALIEVQVQRQQPVSILWQALAYFILTASEVMVYGTGLEFSYTQAPPSMKSFIMGLFLLSVSFGNLITALINHIILNEDGTSLLEGAWYYIFFVAIMFATAVGFIFYAKNFKYQTYIRE